MERNNLATAAIIVCMVCAVSTIPALMIAGSFQAPVVNNYYTTTTTTPTPVQNTTTTTITTNVTYYVNGTLENHTCHFINVTKLIPYRSGGQINASICDIPLEKRTMITNVMTFSFNRRSPGVGGTGYQIESLLNGKTVYNNGYGFPIFSGCTTTDSVYYTIWSNPYHAIVSPNASGMILNIIGYSSDPNFPSGINVSVAVWWETW